MYVTVIRIINHHRAHWDKRNNNFPLAFTENEKDNLSVSQIIEKAMVLVTAEYNQTATLLTPLLLAYHPQGTYGSF